MISKFVITGMLLVVVVVSNINFCAGFPDGSAQSDLLKNHNSTLLNRTVKAEVNATAVNSTAAVREVNTSSEEHERGFVDSVKHGFESLACKVGINSACETKSEEAKPAAAAAASPAPATHPAADAKMDVPHPETPATTEIQDKGKSEKVTNATTPTMS